MVAVMASSTVELSFTGHPVPAGRVTATLPLAQWRQPGRGRPALERLAGPRPGRAVR